MKYNQWANGRRIYICQNSIHIWVALQTIMDHIENLDKETKRKNLKEAILSYPSDTNGCKCSYCRYHRIFNRRCIK